MLAAIFAEYGPPENLSVGETPRPTPGAGELLVRVAAAGVNPIDARLRSGRRVQERQDHSAAEHSRSRRSCKEGGDLRLPPVDCGRCRGYGREVIARREVVGKPQNMPTPGRVQHNSTRPLVIGDVIAG